MSVLGDNFMIEKTFRKITFAQILIAFAVTACMFVDGVLIGKFLGPNSISAFGLCSSLISLTAAFGGTLSSGVQVVAGNALGRGDKKQLNSIYSTSITTGIVVSVLFTVLSIIFCKQISLFLGAPAGTEIEVRTNEYLVSYMLGTPAFLLFQALSPFLQLYDDRKSILLGVLVMTIGDIVGDLANVLIFRGGIFGMGIASSLSYYASLVVMIAAVLKKKFPLKLHLKEMNMKILYSIVCAGISYAIYQVSKVIFYIFTNRVFYKVGGAQLLTAYSIVKNIYTIFVSVGMGIASTTLLMSGIVYGENNRKSLEDVVSSFLKYSVIFNGAVIVIVEIFAKSLCHFFMHSNSGSFDLTVSGLKIYILGIIFFSINTCLYKLFQGMKQNKVSYMVCVIDSVIVPVLTIMIGLKLFGNSSNVLWISMSISEVIFFVLITIYCAIKAKKVFPLKEVYILNAVKKEGKEPVICIVKNIEDAIEASKKIEEIHKENFPNTTRSFPLALCVEEVTVNYFEHGLKPNKKSGVIEVRYTALDDKCRLEFRDNGKSFDPCAYYEMHEQEDTVNHMGLKIILSLADDIKYTNVVGLNSLVIEMKGE